jgi:quinol monooxygenase YgiN
MAVVIVHLKIKQFASWKTGFDSNEAMRTAAGLMNVRILQSVDDPNEVCIQSETNDVAKAKQFLTSPNLNAVMEKTGVISPPAIYFLNPV